jgi:hypothetical protein
MRQKSVPGKEPATRRVLKKIRRATPSRCCARAASGHAAAPLMSVMELAPD